MTFESDEEWEAYKAKRAKEAEQELERREARFPGSTLTPQERRKRSKIAAANRRKRDQARAEHFTCAMPLCGGRAIRHGLKSLAICIRCSFAVLDYFNEIDEMPGLSEAAADREVKRVVLQQRTKADAESRRIKPGWIYYILVGERIKIGYTTDLKQRLRQYPPDTPLLAMHPGTKQLESEMHAKFAGSRAAGREWFLDTPEIQQHIREVITQFGEPDRP